MTRLYNTPYGLVRVHIQTYPDDTIEAVAPGYKRVKEGKGWAIDEDEVRTTTDLIPPENIVKPSVPTKQVNKQGVPTLK